jgi:hypothetical protein
VRVPIYVTLPLVGLTIGLIWWQGTKEKNFTSPPADSALATVREKTLVELKATDSIAPEEPSAAIKVKPTKLVLPESEEPGKPAPPTLQPQDFGELTVSPALDCYLPLAERGADVMVDLATQLELKSEAQRALLAWERVLDATPATPEQQETARKAITRLRPQVPLWNVDPLTAQRIVLHVGCDRDRAKVIEPILQEIAASLNETSAGLIECKLELQAGAKPDADKPRQPIALWFQGPSSDSTASKTLTIPTLPENLPEQKNLLLFQIYKLIRDGISAQSTLRPLFEPPSGGDAELLLRSAITRRGWALWSQTFPQKAP